MRSTIYDRKKIEENKPRTALNVLYAKEINLYLFYISKQLWKTLHDFKDSK